MACIKPYGKNKWRVWARPDGSGGRKSKTFDLKRDAEHWGAMIEARQGVSEFDVLQMKQARVTTVKSLFERYRDEVAVNMKGRNEVGTLNRLIRDAAFIALRLDRITPRNIRDWRDDRVKGDKEKGIKPVQPASVQREMNTISGVFTHAIKEWSVALNENPCHLVSGMRGSDKPRDKRWSEADTVKFLKAAGWSDTLVPKVGRDYVGWALLLAIETAMRVGELCLPTVADFHSDEKYVHLKDTKNGDVRNVPLSVAAIKYLTHLCADKKPGDKIIPINANTMNEYVLEVRQACGLEHLLFHDTRHEAVTRLSKKLSNVLELSAVTGHRSLKSLKRYYNPEPHELASKLG